VAGLFGKALKNGRRKNVKELTKKAGYGVKLVRIVQMQQFNKIWLAFLLVYAIM